MKKFGKNAAKLALALTFAATCAASAFGGLTAKAATVSEDTSGLTTSNLFTDGGFEDVTKEDTGDWLIDTTSSAASGSWDILSGEDSYAGEQAIKLTAPGNSSGYPEIAQVVDVYANTDYVLSFRLRSATTNLGSANIYFGFASEEREDETMYVQQQRWADNIVDTNRVKTNDEGEWEYYNGYSLFSGVFNTGNHTSLRAFIRLQKMTAYIDNVSLTLAEDVITPGSENLLKEPGFEGSDAENKEIWVGESENGMGYGFDTVPAGLVPAGSELQDKNSEGEKAMYLVADAGVMDGSITVKQKVQVEPDSYYAFYASVSKWINEYSDISLGAIGISGINADGSEEQLALNRMKGEDISATRYTTLSTHCNVGDFTEVYVYVTCSVKEAAGSYGVGLYVDDTKFFKVGEDLPEGKTNLIKNGTFEKGDDSWWLVGGSSQVGVDTDDSKCFYGGKNIWLSQWNPGDGIYQVVELKAGQMYKMTARIRPYISGTASTMYDSLYSPVVLTATPATETEEGAEITGEPIARAAYRMERDNAYMPVSLIFTPETSGTYKIFVGFDGAYDPDLGFQGGVQIGAVSMYETSEEELSVIIDDGEETEKLVNTSDKITIDGTSITLSESMTAEEFEEFVYAGEGYAMTLQKADGSALAAGDKLTTGCKLVLTKDGETVETYTITAPADGGNDGDSAENSGSSSGSSEDGGCGSNLIFGGSMVAIGAVLAAAGALIFAKRRERK